VIEENSPFAKRRQEFYRSQYRAGERIDPWHAFAQHVVHSTTRKWFFKFNKVKNPRILNAGSGGSDYEINSPMIHLDLVSERITKFPDFIIGDISRIPLDDCSIDVILCVGSVLNYANPLNAIVEFERVLRPNGLLILEYERSGSPEYWRTHGPFASCKCVNSFYGSVKTQLWVYGDRFIDNLLSQHKLTTQKEERFHGVSSIVLSLSGAPGLAARFVLGDRMLANIWPVSTVASNRILAIKKLAD
jgi:SAM-dependent methyltransferase